MAKESENLFDKATEIGSQLVKLLEQRDQNDKELAKFLENLKSKDGVNMNR